MQAIALRAERACEIFVRVYVGGTILTAAAVTLAAPGAVLYLLFRLVSQ